MLAPDAGSTDTTAIAFPNDMSRSKYPMMHESWLFLPLPPPAAVNWLTSAPVQRPGAAPWAEAAGLPPPHAVTVKAVTAAASDPARRSCLLRALMSTMILPFSEPAQSGQDRYRFFRDTPYAGTPRLARVSDIRRYFGED
jgi:hypothetical protein